MIKDELFQPPLSAPPSPRPPLPPPPPQLADQPDGQHQHHLRLQVGPTLKVSLSIVDIRKELS